MEAIYEWMRNLAYFYILISIVFNVIPEETYGKYVKFFVGMLLILLVLRPVFQWLNIEQEISRNFIWQSARQQWVEIENEMR